MVVLHFTGMASAQAALARLCDPAAEVSAHYLIAGCGQVWCLVAEAERTWHAGVGQWGGVSDVNSRSIGIELASPGPLEGFPPFPEPQMRALEALLDGIMSRWGIAPERIIAHSDMAPERKFDPGPKLDWRRLAIDGCAVWAVPNARASAGWPAFRDAAARFGYVAPDGDWKAVLGAFRLHFRPAAATLDLEAADVAMIEVLADEYPCIDRTGPRA
jgi:N-acetylmuramoyl-L-alanine amidase